MRLIYLILYVLFACSFILVIGFEAGSRVEQVKQESKRKQIPGYTVIDSNTIVIGEDTLKRDWKPKIKNK
jgi:hypothetical protein